MWDPSTYLRYGSERSRPFFDLVARVGAGHPRAVADLGCGPGTLTAALAERWPGAAVHGLDSSPEMIERAGALDTRATFEVGDVADWQPAPDTDVVVSNALLQWVPDHERLLTRWVAALPAGAWLAVQVPGNFDGPAHRALRATGGDRLAHLFREAPVRDPAGYADLLLAAGCAVDAWETTYLHLLPAGTVVDHPVLTWLEGTALRPVRAALDADQWSAFRSELDARLRAAYPVRHGVVPFPFRRVFVVARVP
ncbi:trans-aconitate 2-methyltransferase [Rhizomonospora bruguierae]|uniref:trans-aconitate 2-methyltransferase n=1 Tax=Rhizomonospora bruguierae TaxID=1581705 RepID=UPI001BD1511F|nr:trans-aconitate 2-methyltransferase [Micromonospora sp. NBRC 107566]